MFCRCSSTGVESTPKMTYSHVFLAPLVAVAPNGVCKGVILASIKDKSDSLENMIFFLQFFKQIKTFFNENLFEQRTNEACISAENSADALFMTTVPG